MPAFTNFRAATHYLINHAADLGLPDSQIETLREMEREVIYVATGVTGVTGAAGAAGKPEGISKAHFEDQAAQLGDLLSGVRTQAKDPLAEEALAFVIWEAARYLGENYSPALVVLSGTVEDFLMSRGYRLPTGQLQVTSYPASLDSLIQFVGAFLGKDSPRFNMILGNEGETIWFQEEGFLPLDEAQSGKLVEKLNQTHLFRERPTYLIIDTPTGSSIPIVLSYAKTRGWFVERRKMRVASLFSNGFRYLSPSTHTESLLRDTAIQLAKRAVVLWKEAGASRIVSEISADLAVLYDGVDEAEVSHFLDQAFADGPNPRAISALVMASHKMASHKAASQNHRLSPPFSLRLNNQPYLWVPPTIYLDYAIPLYTGIGGEAVEPFVKGLHHRPGIFLSAAGEKLNALYRDRRRHPKIRKLQEDGISYDLSLLLDDFIKLDEALKLNEFMIIDADGLVQAVLRHRFAEWMLEHRSSDLLSTIVEAILTHAPLINHYLHNHSDNPDEPTAIPLLDAEDQVVFLATLRGLERRGGPGVPPVAGFPVPAFSRSGGTPTAEGRRGEGRYRASAMVHRMEDHRPNTALWHGGVVYTAGVSPAVLGMETVLSL